MRTKTIADITRDGYRCQQGSNPYRPGTPEFYAWEQGRFAATRKPEPARAH